jgi:mycofactocin precursor
MSEPTMAGAVESEPEQDTGQPETAAIARAEAGLDPEALIDDELLVEDVSIDGMCGVY